MATRRPGKPETSTGGNRSASKVRAASVLGNMTASELATVLRILLTKHPHLGAEAESIAIEMISSPSVENIADDVLDAVVSLDIDSLNQRAGEQVWGYVEPSEAAWELLGEAIEDVIADMKRRMGLGLHEAAQAICCGVVLGLHKANDVESDGPLSWAPDFPAEEACHAVSELIRACPTKHRRAVLDQILEVLGRLAPGWQEMIARAAESALNDR